MPLYMAVFA